ncbi:FabZ [Mangrovimonas yunxiaonensis]|uniref:FabZ n=1 Tax=Mangrovimonas yunxiaonensis TaxID=1197477 RepID=A0A084TK81_9FLAO|nr:FabZ [Mangrovimonas yunxiaonensis]KFB01117.1 FabZ [Mangrovimonas yunxiaonensis]MBR9757902.1 hypothetical protein [Algicola sp.]GGH38563.1 hypothetical protein GCM10011364_07430 [Mangrovimonas yunxiaonensis]
MNNLLPTTQIQHLIPQKAPFVMVDQLVDFSPQHVTASLTITPENTLVKDGIFTEPGVVEHMAQTVALHTGYAYFLKGEKAPTGYIGSIKKITIHKLPALSETITTKAEILHEFMGVTMVKVSAFNTKNEAIASGEMKTVIANE